MPNGKTLKQKRSYVVWNVVNGLVIPRLAYSARILNLSLLKTLEPGNGPRVLSTAESGWFSQALNLLINIAQVYTDPNFSATLGSYLHGLIPINELVYYGYDGRLLHSIQLFF